MLNITEVNLLAAREGYVQASLKVESEHCNVRGHLHGGMAASLVDMLSTMALMTYDTSKPGVSVDISLSFLAAAKQGSEVIISAESLKQGKNLAFLTANITDATTGKLLITGKHTKYIA
ncbi:acyl-coenzyme A thioesterase 13 isoform X2 [Hyalella azteca]|uniref:Acyl-coenzyme A thioesterase 13 n=1 Tax=Hyalella azteca TaxID=294128 RepID=A0A8B7PGZ3_HYAAZ|nr:acyl-coenzyme A thioesterase 13 isoform X2 [Hyalella azteca]